MRRLEIFDISWWKFKDLTTSNVIPMPLPLSYVMDEDVHGHVRRDVGRSENPGGWTSCNVGAKNLGGGRVVRVGPKSDGALPPCFRHPFVSTYVLGRLVSNNYVVYKHHRKPNRCYSYWINSSRPCTVRQCKIWQDFHLLFL